jgi:hypothetical protein
MEAHLDHHPTHDRGESPGCDGAASCARQHPVVDLRRALLEVDGPEPPSADHDVVVGHGPSRACLGLPPL